MLPLQAPFAGHTNASLALTRVCTRMHVPQVMHGQGGQRWADADKNSGHAVAEMVQLCLLPLFLRSITSCVVGVNLVVGQQANQVLEHNFGIFRYHSAQFFATATFTHRRTYARPHMVREIKAWLELTPRIDASHGHTRHGRAINGRGWRHLGRDAGAEDDKGESAE